MYVCESLSHFGHFRDSPPHDFLRDVFNVYFLIFKFIVVGFGPDPDRCPTDVCRYVTGVVA